MYRSDDTSTCGKTSTTGGNCYMNNAPSADIDDIAEEKPRPKRIPKTPGTAKMTYKKTDLRYSHSKQIRSFYKMRGNR